jgi:hypothetical protein
MQLVLAVLAMLVMASCGGSSPTAPTASGKAIVIPFSVTSSATRLIVGETATVRVNLGTSTAFTPRWDSDDPTILRVTADGLVTSVGFGVGVITARHPDGSDANITIDVFPELRTTFELTLIRVSCKLIVLGPVNWGECAEDGSMVQTELIILDQTHSIHSSGLPTMSLTGFYKTAGMSGQGASIEATLNSIGLVDWSTSDDSSYTHDNTGTGTRTVRREGFFSVFDNGYQIAMAYDLLSWYRGFPDASIDVTYDYEWGGTGWGFGHGREFAHVTPLPFEQLEVPTRSP